ILEQVEGTPSSYGVVPVENACAGFIGDVIKFWLKGQRETKIVGQHLLPVTHMLMVHPSHDPSTPISRVFSHEQALSQCADTLSELGIHEREKISSTSAAAAYVRDHPGEPIAAIAAPLARELYGLKPIHENIADSMENATRFHIIANQMPLPVPTGNDRTAILFELPNHAGALCQVITPIAKLKVNLAVIHSVQLGRPDAHAFYLEFDAHQDDPQGREILNALQTLTTRLEVLGSFSRANCERMCS
ncbi:MAG: hypothetical protein KBB55_01550, partial [Candidatus Buchananbacteria bacterium]|nr:hypothetical protein [Candidatus Buchananbacteria bacterium]